ncbi:MAG: arginase family protein [Bacteroidia bacterium]
MGLQVVGIACDWGAKQPGGAAGVQSWYALAQHYKHLAWLEAKHLWIAPTLRHPVWLDTGNHLYAHRLEYWLEFAQEVEKALESLSLTERLLFLTGDHSWAGIILPFLAAKVGDLGVIWLDAHADFHNPATSPSGNLHGMPLAMATGLNTYRFHSIPKATWEMWESLVRQAVPPDNLLMVGLRSYEPPELDILQAHHIRYFTAEAIAQQGIEPVHEAIEALRQRTQRLYVSLDVDVWDPSFARGTGSPAPGGLSIAQLRLLLNDLLRWKETAFVEVTEINPLLDRENQTALYAYGTIRPFIDGESVADASLE